MREFDTSGDGLLSHDELLHAIMHIDGGKFGAVNSLCTHRRSRALSYCCARIDDGDSTPRSLHIPTAATMTRHSLTRPLNPGSVSLQQAEQLVRFLDDSGDAEIDSKELGAVSNASLAQRRRSTTQY